MIARIVFTVCALALALPATALEVKLSAPQEVSAPREERILPGSMTAEIGFCFTAPLRMGAPGDSESGNKSGCILMEDGKPLGSNHTLHDDIRAKGKGGYSHWTATCIYFSTSDNSDPRTNGRTYTLVGPGNIRGTRRSAVVTVTDPVSSYDVQPMGKNIVNRRLVLKNLDDRVAVSPVLRVSGFPDFTSCEGMLASVLKPGMTSEQKSIAIWKFLSDWRYHWCPAEEFDEIHDPVKFLNVYGYGFCDDSAQNFAALCEVAGLKARVWGLQGHVVAESFYDNAWHMFDPDHKCCFRAPDNHILSVEELAKDTSAITAKPTDPTGYSSAELAKLYTTTADNSVCPRTEFKPAFRLDPLLQPGDEVVFDLGPAKLVHIVCYRKEAGLPPKAAVGTLTRNVNSSAAESELLIPVKWPYVILGGQLALKSAGDTKPEVSLSVDGRTWTPVVVTTEGAKLTADFTPWFVAQNAAHYAFTLRVRSAVVKDVTLTTLFQFAPRTLPQVQTAATTFDVTLASTDGVLPQGWKGLQITHVWDEAQEPSAK